MNMIAIGNGGAGAGGIDAKYKIIPIPITEADADADSCVGEFNGAAGTNEVLVGGPVSGANLVLTQYGNVGSDGTHRVIQDGVHQSFRGTEAYYSAFAQSAKGWTCVLRNKDLNGTFVLLQNLGAEAASGHKPMELYTRKRHSMAMIGTSTSPDGGLGVGLSLVGNNPMWPVANESYMHIYSLDYESGLCFAGLRVDDGLFPTSLADFIFIEVAPYVPVSGIEPVTTYHDNKYKCILGSQADAVGSGYAGGQTIVSLTMSNKPCFVPA